MTVRVYIQHQDKHLYLINTIAADESIPFGTKLSYRQARNTRLWTEVERIRGTGRLDIAVQTHDEALRAGVVQADVWIVEVANDKET